MYSLFFIVQVKLIYKEHLDGQIAEKKASLELLIEQAKQREKEDCVLIPSADSPGRNLNQLLRPDHFSLGKSDFTKSAELPHI